MVYYNPKDIRYENLSKGPRWNMDTTVGVVSIPNHERQENIRKADESGIPYSVSRNLTKAPPTKNELKEARETIKDLYPDVSVADSNTCSWCGRVPISAYIIRDTRAIPACKLCEADMRKAQGG